MFSFLTFIYYVLFLPLLLILSKGEWVELKVGKIKGGNEGNKNFLKKHKFLWHLNFASMLRKTGKKFFPAAASLEPWTEKTRALYALHISQDATYISCHKVELLYNQCLNICHPPMKVEAIMYTRATPLWPGSTFVLNATTVHVTHRAFVLNCHSLAHTWKPRSYGFWCTCRIFPREIDSIWNNIELTEAEKHTYLASQPGSSWDLRSLTQLMCELASYFGDGWEIHIYLFF